MAEPVSLRRVGPPTWSGRTARRGCIGDVAGALSARGRVTRRHPRNSNDRAMAWAPMTSLTPRITRLPIVR